MILIKTKIKIKQQLQNNICVFKILYKNEIFFIIMVIIKNIFYNNGNSGNLLHQISTACS